MPTRSAALSRRFLATMPRIRDAIGFENGLLRGTVTFGREARDQSTGHNTVLAAQLGPNWEREGRVSADPATLECERYLAGCKAAQPQEADPSSGYGLGMLDNPAWGTPIVIDEISGAATSESTRATLVSFTPQDEPAGHISLNISIWTNADDWSVAMYADVLIVYVRPQYRGKGYGIDLSVAGGWVMGDMVKAVIAAIPDGGSFRFNGMAEYLSKGGEQVCRAVWNAAEAAQLASRDPGKPRLALEPAIIRISP